jgi:ABC-type glutathione transport system ATPase component
MTDDVPASMAEAMAEIRRLRHEIEALNGLVSHWRDTGKRLCARVVELEAGAAVTLGTLEQPTDDEPAAYTHNVPPSAPPHETPSNPVKPPQTETSDE